jgi:hypothetical protein
VKQKKLKSDVEADKEEVVKEEKRKGQPKRGGPVYATSKGR